MSVRGAPAIGCAAAYGLALAAREKTFSSFREQMVYLERAKALLAATRPTAVNLFQALNRMARLWVGHVGSPKDFAIRLAQEAQSIFDEDIKSCRRMGVLGAELLPKNSIVLTHCNTGALATAGHGTALGVIRSAYAQGKIQNVFVDETRPYLQGSRLTAWELEREGIPYEIITDNMAGHFLKTEKIAAILVGADRIAANGDTANKIGTYSLAVLAQYHHVPFYVVAPTSTVDPKAASGNSIPIEERSPREVLTIRGIPVAPRRARARHPAFDVTPAKLITAIITDRGVIRPPFQKKIQKQIADDSFF
jgi:methylthioribose-1-phosphate isomerase